MGAAFRKTYDPKSEAPPGPNLPWVRPEPESFVGTLKLFVGWFVCFLLLRNSILVPALIQTGRRQGGGFAAERVMHYWTIWMEMTLLFISIQASVCLASAATKEPSGLAGPEIVFWRMSAVLFMIASATSICTLVLVPTLTLTLATIDSRQLKSFILQHEGYFQGVEAGFEWSAILPMLALAIRVQAEHPMWSGQSLTDQMVGFSGPVLFLGIAYNAWRITALVGPVVKDPSAEVRVDATWPGLGCSAMADAAEINAQANPIFDCKHASTKLRAVEDRCRTLQLMIQVKDKLGKDTSSQLASLEELLEELELCQHGYRDAGHVPDLPDADHSETLFNNFRPWEDLEVDVNGNNSVAFVRD